MPIEDIAEGRVGYYAGFFDGEGWVGVVRRSQIDRRNGRRYVCYTLMIGAGQCDPRPVRMLQKAFGGSLSVSRQQKAVHLFYSWQVASIKAERFLRLVQPYLIHKKEQCEVALSFREFVRERRRYGPGKMPPEYHQMAQEYADLMKRVRAETRVLKCPS